MTVGIHRHESPLVDNGRQDEDWAETVPFSHTSRADENDKEHDRSRSGGLPYTDLGVSDSKTFTADVTGSSADTPAPKGASVIRDTSPANVGECCTT